jgi:hypothetical protein
VPAKHASQTEFHMSATAATYAPPPEIQGPTFHHALPVNPAALLLPRMEPKARRELAEDIKANGQKMPVVILVDTDYKRSLLDGISRLEALELIGRQVIKNGVLNPDVVLLQEISGVDPFAYVLSVNLRRRHLKPKDKRELAGKLLEMFPNKSDRQIAELAGLSHPMIKEVRNELVGCGKIFHVSHRLDATGKRRQPATKQPPKESKESLPSVSVTAPESAKHGANIAATNNAILQEIAKLGREIRSLLNHLTPDNREGIYKRVVQIIRLTSFETKSHSKAPENSNAKLDLDAFKRVLGHA